MKIYKDLITGDEVLSDTYDITIIDDVIFEVKTKMVTKKDSVKVDIGANPSSEKGEGEEEGEEEQGIDEPTAVVVNNVVDAHRLTDIGTYDQKSFVSWAKQYSKAVYEALKKDENPRAEAFKKGMSAVIPKILGNLKNYSAFYLGESSNPDGTVILAFYKDEDQHNPFLWYFRDGLQEEKV